MIPETPVTNWTVSPSFECDAEMHPLAEFQAQGHFVCGMTDENGFRRPWGTEWVHVLTLKHKGEQVLRIMADTRAEANRLMEGEITRTFFALWLGNRQTGMNFEAFRTLNDKYNELQAWMNVEYQHEIETGRHAGFKTVFDAAVWYMRKERKRPSVRIGRLLRRQKTAQQSEWVPQEWRQ